MTLYASIELEVIIVLVIMPSTLDKVLPLLSAAVKCSLPWKRDAATVNVSHLRQQLKIDREIFPLFDQSFVVTKTHLHRSLINF